MLHFTIQPPALAWKLPNRVLYLTSLPWLNSSLLETGVLYGSPGNGVLTIFSVFVRSGYSGLLRVNNARQ